MTSERPNPSGASHSVARPGAAAGSVGVAGRFREVWTGAADPTTAIPELLPVRLARACREVLPVDGAGVSLLNDDFRVPLGASHEPAALAERLQFTVGEGPCLTAATEQRSLVSDAAQIQERWPAYADELFSRTPYRAIVALPLEFTPHLRGAVDLFFTEPAGMGHLDLTDAAIVTEQVLTALLRAQHGAPQGDRAQEQAWSGDDPQPAWLRSPAARDRTNVWVAIGVVMTRYDLTAPDALALLRSYAYGQGAVLDDIAADVMSGDLDVARMQP